MAKAKEPAPPPEGRDLDQKYRPRTLDELVGQAAMLSVIRGWKGAVPRAVMFDGPPGTGKTTTAKALCRQLGIEGRDLQDINCGRIESPIGLVRDIAAAMTMSALGAAGRVAWILDEVQTFSKQKGAQEALLKVLEDCPDHVYFFLCTTDAKRVLPAVRSRCCQITLAPLKEDEVRTLVGRIAAAEGIVVDDDLMDAIVATAEGSGRCAVKALEKVAGIADVDEARRALGGGYGPNSEAFDLVKAVLPFKGGGTWAETAKVLTQLEDEDPEGLRQMLLSCARGRLLKGGASASMAYRLIICLEKPLYDRNSGKALLAAALYEFHNSKG